MLGSSEVVSVERNDTLISPLHAPPPQVKKHKMDYKYDDGIELLLAHMNIEDIIDAVESLYQVDAKEAGREGSGFDDEEEENDEMDDNEEAGETPVGVRRGEGDAGECGEGGEERGGIGGDGVEASAGGVKYGKVVDLLDFINLISNMSPGERQHLPEEMGVVLNKVRGRVP